ncbi:MAG: hypothetical protein P8Y36_14605, partial [Alphaproteobacteria bacterium]
MTRWLKLWLMLIAFIATGWGSASAAPSFDPGYAKLNADHVIRVEHYRRRENFWRRWMRRGRRFYERQHRRKDNYREDRRHRRRDEAYVGQRRSDK